MDQSQSRRLTLNIDSLPPQTAEVLYKKRQKKEAPKGWESFNQHTLFRGYEKRSDKIDPDMEVRAMLLT
jgi:hypothetical protein